MRFLVAIFLLAPSLASADSKKWNIVLIGAEDISPNLGCYGDMHAITPNLDKLAKQGARFERCFTHAPVCAPSRSGLITGMYPTTIGSHHMRSKLIDPPTTFTAELRKGGYFVAYPGKTDFNFDVPKDAFDSTQNWLVNPPKEPFFAYINFTITHESQIRATPEQYQKNTARLKPEERHDPTKMPLPPYYPDASEVRKNVATYYDNITALDYLVGDVMASLEKNKLVDNTVVIFFGDHGWGMSRGKRWLYDSGLRCPLIVRWPSKVEAGSVRHDLVAFVDLAPTILSIAGVPIPAKMQGQIFLGDKKAPDRKYVYAARDRMDETFDRIRAVRDSRYKYIRNFYPQLPYAQWIDYMDQMPTMQVWRKWNEEGKLKGPQKLFFAATKPKEELYDCDKDPYEVENLTNSKDHHEKLKELRSALDKWIIDTRDLGEVSETELVSRGLVRDMMPDCRERLKKHPAWSQASSLAPKD